MTEPAPCREIIEAIGQLQSALFAVLAGVLVNVLIGLRMIRGKHGEKSAT